jgi:hypothetical protein
MNSYFSATILRLADTENRAQLRRLAQPRGATPAFGTVRQVLGRWLIDLGTRIGYSDEVSSVKNAALAAS